MKHLNICHSNHFITDSCIKSVLIVTISDKSVCCLHFHPQLFSLILIFSYCTTDDKSECIQLLAVMHLSFLCLSFYHFISVFYFHQYQQALARYLQQPCLQNKFNYFRFFCRFGPQKSSYT